MGQWETLKRGLAHVTIEPMMFISAMAVIIPSISQDQLIIYKTCIQPEFGLSQEFCDNINLNTNSSEYEEFIEPAVAQYNVIRSVVEHALPIVLSFYLGAWTDHFGRKPLIYATQVGKLSSAAFALLNVYFMSWSKEIYLASAVLPEVLTGGYLASMLASYSFISDNSKPRHRTIRLATISLAWNLANPLGTLAGSALFSTGGFKCVFGTKVALLVLSLGLYLIRLWNFEEEVIKRRMEAETRGEKIVKATFKNLLHPRHVMDSLRTIFHRRLHHKRAFLLILLAMTIFVALPGEGEGVFQYLYVVRFFNWGVTEYSNYRTFSTVIGALGMIIAIPLFHCCNAPDALIAVSASILHIGSKFLLGFASEPWMFYAASLMEFLGSCSSPAIRAMMSKCVPPEDLGKVFAILSSSESLVPIIASPIYSKVYLSTVDSDIPGTAYLMSVAFLIVHLLLGLLILIVLKCKNLKDDTNTDPNSTDETVTEEFSSKPASLIACHPDNKQPAAVQIFDIIPLDHDAHI